MTPITNPKHKAGRFYRTWATYTFHIGTRITVVLALVASLGIAPVRAEPAARNPLASLGNSTLLIIAPEEFLNALQPLVKHKNSTGMPANAVSIAELTASFPGADDPEKIKRGIQYAYEHLSTQYVMLVGDAQWFPTRYLYMKKLSRYYPNHPRPPSLPVDGVFIPSDLFYASLYHHQITKSQGVDVKSGPFDDWDANKNGYYNEAT